MSLKVIGAGLGRTGTMSLKLALERLLGGPCYHMSELLQKHLADHTPYWHAAARGEKVDWDEVFRGYAAAVDEPASLFWKELADYYPEALVILSLRDPQSWWQSADSTILPVKRHPPPPGREAWHAMILDAYARVYPEGVSDPRATQRRFLEHNARVKAEVPPRRLLLWQVKDGWGPICEALGLPVPDEPFPHVNTTKEFKARQPGKA